MFFGNNLVTEEPYPEMHQDVFKLFCEIIEITHKPKTPTGELAKNPSGQTFEINEGDIGRYSYRAILDLGLLDVNIHHLFPEDEEVKIISASSDMLIADLGNNRSQYKVGDYMSFNVTYMGALRLLSSDYIDKTVVE